MTQADNQKVQFILEGEYVRRKPDAKKTYILGAYDEETNSYELTDADDMNRSIWVKHDTFLFVNFTY